MKLRSKSTLRLIGLFLSGCILAGAVMPGCQSRGVSRMSGKELQLKLPKDFVRPISFATGREGEKDLFYEASDGNFRVKTYTDSGFFESSIKFVNDE